MRISDWSSDVCSSDRQAHQAERREQPLIEGAGTLEVVAAEGDVGDDVAAGTGLAALQVGDRLQLVAEIGRAPCRERVRQYGESSVVAGTLKQNVMRLSMIRCEQTIRRDD